MSIRTVMAVVAGVALGAAMTIATRSLPRWGMPEAAPADKCQIAKIATDWFRGHCQNVELPEPAMLGDGIAISGKIAYRKGLFRSYGLEIAVCPSNETVVIRGTCPIEVKDERMAEMREFAVRADFKTRESIATLYLDADGRLRCRTSMPFDALLIDSEEAMWMMAASLESKILACERAARLVCAGDCSPTVAVGDIKEFCLLAEDSLDNGSYKCVPDGFAVYDGLPPVEDAVKSWFDREQGYYEMHRDPCMTRFTGFWRYFDDDYFDTVCYRVDIYRRILVGVCDCPVSMHGNEGNGEVAELASAFNSRHDRASLKVDLDAGRLTTQCEMPVSVLRRPRSQSRFRAVAGDITGIPDSALVEIYDKLQLIMSAK